MTPTVIAQASGTTIATITLSVVNYSAYHARNVSVDGKFEDRYWTSEWLKARDESKAKGDAVGAQLDYPYFAAARGAIPVIRAGEVAAPQLVANALSLETVCERGNAGVPILLRVTWQSENGHTFDVTQKYQLLCTKNTEGKKVGKGRAFTFIPQGVISRKESASLAQND